MTIQRKTLSPASPTWPRHALGRACLLALAGFSSVGWAQTVPSAALSVVNASLPSTETAGAVWSANYGLITGESQFGEGMLGASIAAVPIGSSLTGGGVSPVTVSNNTLQSLAFGNQTSSSTGLSLLTSSLLSRNLQSLSGLIQPGEGEAPSTIGSLSVSATVSGSSAFITQSGMQSADLALTGNTLKASTQLNVADTRVSGAVPSGFTSAATGSSEVAFDAGGASIGTPTAITSQAGTTGTVNLSTLQSTFSASPTATVSASNVTLTVSGTPVVGGAATSQFTNDASVNGNTLSATTGINTATSIFQAEAGSAAWTGSVSVTNLQNASTVDGTTDSLASVSGSAVTADLRFGLNGQTDLTGSLTLSDNKISATSTGNSAGARTTSGAIAAGNAITFDGGADITGSASGTGTSVNLASGTAQAVADLTLLNAQANAASSFTTTVTDGGVTSRTDNLAGGTITQSGNAITASSTANLAGNLVSAGQGGSVANFTASVAALNVQSNTGLASTASVESSAVSAVVGIADAVPTGTVTLSNNTLAATAEGNLGVTTVALKADNLTVSGTLGKGATQGVTLTPATGSASAGLGVVALSAQSNAGGSLAANNNGTSVSLSFNDQTIDPENPDYVPLAIDFSAMSATLSGNRLQSTATANSASTSATLEGSNGTGLSAAVGNSQRNTDMAVEASAGATTPLAVSLTAGAVTASTLTLADNSLSAAATGNSASSRLSVSLATASGDAALSPSATASVGSTAVTSLADVALANSQINDTTDVTAAMAGRVSLDVGTVGSVANTSTLVVSTNQIGATAEVNRASNALALDVGTLSGMTSALASQQVISDSVATASTVGTVELLAGAVAGSALTASANTVKSTTLGNGVNNELSLKGTSASGTGTVPTAALAGATTASTVADASLTNVQSASGATLSAATGVSSVAPAAVSLDLGAVSGASTLNLRDSTVSATTSVNSASNALSLDITNVTGMTAGLASAQTLSDSTANAVTYGLVGVNAASLTGSSATVSGNATAATVFGNSADNSLSLTAAVASGRDVAPALEVGTFRIDGADVAFSKAAGDVVVANDQTVIGTVSPAVLSAISDGTVNISTGTSGALATSMLTLSGNSVSAYTSANSASNEVALNVTDLTAASAGVASRQVIDIADVTSASTGSVLLQGGAVTGSALTLSGNTVKSTSLGNVADNQLSLAGTNATGSSAVVAGTASATAGTSATTQADVAVANLQSSSDIALSATTVGAAGIDVGTVLADSALTLSNNTTSALALSNSASNTLDLASTNVNDMAAAVVSSQRTIGTVEATVSAANPMAPTSAAFLIDATSATSTPVVLSKNTFSAVAGMNEAFNTLTAAGATLLGNGGTPSSSVGVASTTGVDFSVVNAQSGEGSISALADPDTIGFTGSLTGGSLSITENTVLAKASVNTASNQLTLAATSRLEATAAVNNVQVMDSVVSATVVPSILGATLTSGDASTVAVSDNRVTAQATGNLASNALNATAVSGISSSGSSAQPTFAVLNSQTTQATGSIAAVLNGTNLRASLNGTGGSTSVQGNQMVALAYGNSVDNVIGMSALPGGLNTASAAITSVQYNMASISATVSGASLAASGTGTANVSGNTITAQVVGNRSVNSIAAR